jgi:hypothetical protein
VSDTEPEFDNWLGDVASNGSTPWEPLVAPEDPSGQTEFESDNITEPLQVGDGTCHVCGAPTFRPPGLTKTGRQKRTPKYCDLHAPNVHVSDERPSTAGMESELRRLQEELADEVRLFGTLAGPLLPVTGYYLVANADPFTIALLKLCKNQSRLLRVLYRAGQVTPVYTVAKVVAGAAYSVQVDTKGADAHSMVGERLGVSHAYDAVYPGVGASADWSVDQMNNVVSNGFSPPPRYAAAG